MGSTIPAGEFKAKCLHLLDVVAQQREEVLITKRGRPVAKLVPVPQHEALFGALAGSVAQHGDLLSPVDDEWDAAR